MDKATMLHVAEILGVPVDSLVLTPDGLSLLITCPGMTLERDVADETWAVLLEGRPLAVCPSETAGANVYNALSTMIAVMHYPDMLADLTALTLQVHSHKAPDHIAILRATFDD